MHLRMHGHLREITRMDYSLAKAGFHFFFLISQALLLYFVLVPGWTVKPFFLLSYQICTLQVLGNNLAAILFPLAFRVS